MIFSQDLIEEYQRIFKEEHDETLTVEEANEALNNLSGLFIAFADDSEIKRRSVGKLSPPVKPAFL